MRRRRAASQVTLSLFLVSLLVASSYAAVGPSPPSASHAGLVTMATTGAAGPIRAYVTWDGTNISTATSDGSALSVNFASTITLRYYWSSTSLYNVSDARLQMFYFGFALSTRDVVASNPPLANSGTFTMTWAAGAIDYLLEGSYRLTASLLTPGGTTLWSQDFYIHASAPLDVLAAIPIILILIALYEIYGLLTAGRQSAPPPKPKSAAAETPPPKTPPSPTPAETPAPEEENS